MCDVLGCCLDPVVERVVEVRREATAPVSLTLSLCDEHRNGIGGVVGGGTITVGPAIERSFA